MRRSALRSSRTWAAAVAAVLALSLGRLASAQTEPPPDERKQTPVPSAGFWPTERMMQRILDRMADGMAEHYELDDEQLERARSLFKERVPKWFNENRGEIQTLTNEYFEALLAGEPPTPEDVAVWAKRAQPLVNEFMGLVEDTSGELRSFMTDDQALKLDGEVASFKVGIGFLNNKLQTWADGNYDPDTEWPESEGFRSRQRNEQRQLQQDAERASREARGESGIEVTVGTEGADATATTPEGPKSRGARNEKRAQDEWAKYVENFIRRYELNENQQKEARTYLESAYKERDDYLLRKQSEKKRIDALKADAKTDEQRKTAAEALEKYNKPLEHIFEKLKDKLDRLPTRAQQRSAAAKGAAAASGPAKAGSGKDDKPAKPEAERPKEPEGASEPRKGGGR